MKWDSTWGTLRLCGLERFAHSALSILIMIVTVWTVVSTAGAQGRPFSKDLATAAGSVWEFRCDGGDWRPIRVPAGGWTAQGIECKAGTYRTQVEVPALLPRQVVHLRFAAVNFGAVVRAGTDEAHLVRVGSHVNGWMPFEADLTPLIVGTAGAERKAKTLLVQVDVKGREAFRLPNGKFSVAEGASWYPGLADGILRGVDLSVLPAVRIEDIRVITTVGPDRVTVDASLRNDLDGAATVNLAGQFAAAEAPGRRGKQRGLGQAMRRSSVILAPRSSTSVHFDEMPWTGGADSYWWPNVPYRAGFRAKLQAVDLTLTAGRPSGKNLAVLDRRTQRFGFREFKAVGNRYELNGVHVNLRGDNQQEADFGTDAYGVKAGFGPPSAANAGWQGAVDNLQRVNFNVMRIHQIPATPYMLDVADEMGLMLVAESPLRGSEQKEDWMAGRESMLAMDREMVSRDRNHPSIVIWSAANEWADPIPAAIAAIRTVDTTRPIIADGVNRDLGQGIINMEHYVSGITKLPVTGAKVRPDRPYGETEAVWAMDNTAQGFAWTATSTRIRRAMGDADLRNYVFNNQWSNYVPGEGPDTEVLEREVKHFSRMQDLETKVIPVAILDPWNNPHIKLVQQCFAPVAIADLDFDRANAASDKSGNWPVVKPPLSTGPVLRMLTVFNDDLRGEMIAVRWSVVAEGLPRQEGQATVVVPVGEQRALPIVFMAPANGKDAALMVEAAKDGVQRFREDRMVFRGFQEVKAPTLPNPADALPATAKPGH